MDRLGQISFQANDNTDIFLVADVREAGVEISDEALLNVGDPQFESDKAWITGNIPRIKSVQVDGDTSIVQAWFKGELYTDPFVITVYLECELAEELIEAVSDEPLEEEPGSSDLEPQEVNL